MPTPISASMLYDLVQCPHRVTMDLYGDPSRRDKINPFVQLLWEKGTRYEREVITKLEEPFTDLSPYGGEEKARRTLEAMKRGDKLIYSARIETKDLLGDPDLLRRDGKHYIPGDIKSGAAEEGGDDERKPKKHYAVQLALYSDILEGLKLSAGRRGFIWDIHGDEVLYDLMAPQGARKPQSLWDEYQTVLAIAQKIVAAGRPSETTPALASPCKLCHWRSTCLKRMRDEDDLTLIPELGRAMREGMRDQVDTVASLAASHPEKFINGKKTVFPNLGPDRLRRFHARASLLHTNGAPFLTAPLRFPHADLELFFDIEHDPMRDICYLHGFVQRRGGNDATEEYVAFFAEAATAEAERRAFADAWAYLANNPNAAIYYYSKYERTIWRKLRARHSDVCTEANIEALFDPTRAIDLYYDIVRKATEWPTNDLSIKTLAKYLGFNWRDTDPSGAASIDWFDNWIRSGDPAIRQRILEYNEDDCKAVRVLLDGIRRLEPR